MRGLDFFGLPSNEGDGGAELEALDGVVGVKGIFRPASRAPKDGRSPIWGGPAYWELDELKSESWVILGGGDGGCGELLGGGRSPFASGGGGRSSFAGGGNGLE
jgi:hypothetical protein